MRPTNVFFILGAVILFLSLFLGQSARAGFSGDIIIDAALGDGYMVRAGGSGGGIDRGSNVLRCASSLAHPKESNCPNDATYTPSAATGGYQAWAVGVRAITRETEELECFAKWVWVLNPMSPTDSGGELIVICELVVVEVSAGTWGMAMARVKWGAVEAGTAPFGQVPSHPTSVFAFHENLTTPCVPVYYGCANLFDSNYVSDPGYEVEITIADPTCDAGPTVAGLGGRDHDDSDIRDGCFTYHNFPQLSTLPDDYQDTTKFDESRELGIGFGTATAESIEVGKTYVMSQFFQSTMQPVMVDEDAVHSGSITSDLCGPTEGVVEPEYCHFAVDIASVGGGTVQFSEVVIPSSF